MCFFDRPLEYLFLYGSLSLIVIALNAFRYVITIGAGLRASRSMHQHLLQSILGASFSFFDSTPSGRITSRFAVDMSAVDLDIPQAVISVADAVLSIVVGIGLIVIASPIYLLCILPIAYKYMDYRRLYRDPSIDLKKLDSAAKPPVFSHFKEVMEGLECIRGYRIQNSEIRRHHELLDRSIMVRLNWDAVNRWLGIRLDMLGVFIVCFAAICTVFFSSRSPGIAGLLVTYAMRTTSNLSFAVRSSTAMENTFVCAKRITEHIAAPQEEGFALPDSSSLSSSVSSTSHSALTDDELSTNPSDGIELATANSAMTTGIHKANACLVVQNLRARYKESLPEVLHGINFVVPRGRLIGICGRTGCGKSTLALTLAGGVPCKTGDIILEGKPVNEHTLVNYRMLLQVFPQDSYLFSGSVRSILDPSGHYSDVQLLNLLMELNSVIDDSANVNGDANNGRSTPMLHERLGLDYEVSPGGGNLSAGQKQAITLCRAALCTASVVVLDELFSNVDPVVGKKAMKIIARELTSKGVSVLLIAHTLHDIAVCDDVWVMSGGNIVETGTPHQLLTTQLSIFLSMVSELGDVERDRLLRITLSDV